MLESLCFNFMGSSNVPNTMPSGRSLRYVYVSLGWVGTYFVTSQGASILTGLGFTGFDSQGRSQWEGAANVKVMEIEFPSNFKVLLDSWNMKTNVWLRECVYKRVTPKGKKPGFRSSMITFFTSAFWVSCFIVVEVTTLTCFHSTGLLVDIT